MVEHPARGFKLPDDFRKCLFTFLWCVNSDLTSDDKIVLSTSVSKGSYTSSTGILTLGSGTSAITLTLDNISGTKLLTANIYNLKVKNGSDATSETDLVDIISTQKWTVDSGNAILYRDFGSGDTETILTITGLKSGLTATGDSINGIELNGTEVKITSSDVFVGAGTVQITGATGYGFAIESNASSMAGQAGWTTSSDAGKWSASYFASAPNITFSVDSTDTTSMRNPSMGSYPCD